MTVHEYDVPKFLGIEVGLLGRVGLPVERREGALEAQVVLREDLGDDCALLAIVEQPGIVRVASAWEGSYVVLRVVVGDEINLDPALRSRLRFKR